MLTWYAMSVAIMATTSTTTGTATVAAEVAPVVPAASAAPVTPVVEVAPAAPAPEVTSSSPPGSAPITQAPETTAKAVVPAGERFADRFAGSQMWMSTSASFGTFNKGLVLDYNPTVVSFLSLSPRFALNKDFQLRARIGVTYEWTDADFTSTRHVANLTDTTLQLFYRSIPSFFGVKAQVAAQVVLPTSNASNARTMYLSPGLLTQLFRGWEVAGGSVMALGIMSYQRPIYGYTTPGVDTPLPYSQNCGLRVGQLDATSCVNQLSGVANARDIFSWTAILIGAWGDWAPGLALQMSHQFPYSFDAVPGTSDAVVDPNGVRVSTSFSAWIDYTAQPWLTLELGYSYSQNVLSENAQFRNPIYSKYGDPSVYLGVNVGLDQLYDVISGADTGDGGVVRN